jgi:hypothetical protein
MAPQVGDTEASLLLRTDARGMARLPASGRILQVVDTGDQPVADLPILVLPGASGALLAFDPGGNRAVLCSLPPDPRILRCRWPEPALPPVAPDTVRPFLDRSPWFQQAEALGDIPDGRDTWSLSIQGRQVWVRPCRPGPPGDKGQGWIVYESSLGGGRLLLPVGATPEVYWRDPVPGQVVGAGSLAVRILVPDRGLDPAWLRLALGERTLPGTWIPTGDGLPGWQWTGPWPPEAQGDLQLWVELPREEAGFGPSRRLLASCPVTRENPAIHPPWLGRLAAPPRAPAGAGRLLLVFDFRRGEVPLLRVQERIVWSFSGRVGISLREAEIREDPQLAPFREPEGRMEVVLTYVGASPGDWILWSWWVTDALGYSSQPLEALIRIEGTGESPLAEPPARVAPGELSSRWGAHRAELRDVL